MKIEILRLNSINKNGVGGIEAGALNFIYTFILQKYKLDY